MWIMRTVPKFPNRVRQTVGNAAKAKEKAGKKPNSIGWKKTAENESKKIAQARKDEVVTGKDHGVGSSDHFSALKIWMFENKFVSLPSHLKTIEPMARPIRKKSGTGIYHVMLRGINRQDIFEDEEDYRQMTSILRGLTDR